MKKGNNKSNSNDENNNDDDDDTDHQSLWCDSVSAVAIYDYDDYRQTTTIGSILGLSINNTYVTILSSDNNSF